MRGRKDYDEGVPPCERSIGDGEVGWRVCLPVVEELRFDDEPGIPSGEAPGKG